MRRTLSAALLGVACTQPKPEFSAPPPSPCSLPPDSSRAPLGPSCTGSSGCAAAVMDESGAGCCESLWVPGGQIALGFAPDELDSAAPQRENVASVSGFFLDRFQVTLGRFLSFAEQYRGAPEAGAGAHPLIAGSGWQSAWDRLMPASAELLLAAVSCGSPSDPLPLASAPSLASVVDAGAALDGGSLLAEDLDLELPMACLSWFTAFAFCAWDGGRLPTEAEWEYAAAGAVENRRFPWGDDASIAQGLRGDLQSVGSRPLARGCFGHDDLVGSLREWTLDWFDAELPAATSCADDCANLEPNTGRALRGGDCCTGAGTAPFHAAARTSAAPGLGVPDIGVRCARD